MRGAMTKSERASRLAAIRKYVHEVLAFSGVTSLPNGTAAAANLVDLRFLLDELSRNSSEAYAKGWEECFAAHTRFGELLERLDSAPPKHAGQPALL